MKFLVTVKRVTDYEAKIKIKPDGSDIVTEGVNMISNPFDDIGVEEALRQKEKHGGEVVVVSIGTKEATKETILVVNLSGRGDKDIFTVSDILAAKKEQQESGNE